jgi:hypothetical protein
MKKPPRFALLKHTVEVCLLEIAAFARRFSRRPVAILLIIALISTTLLLVPMRSARANSASPGTQAPPPNNAPPELFLIHSPDNGVLLSAISSIEVNASSFAAETKEFISGPAVPDGLGAAHVPTLSERVTAVFTSAASKVAIGYAAGSIRHYTILGFGIRC